MNSVVQEHVDLYLERIRVFYSEVQRWIEPLPILIEETQVLEQASGPYPAPRLLIKTSESEIARLEPVGTWIIGAEGRVDLIGNYDREVILYLKRNGTDRSSGQATGGKREKKEISAALFQGVGQDGWYWIEDEQPGRARFITRDLFRTLVTEVSDYELQ